MKLFRCVCGQILFFHNVSCLSCKRELGFCPDAMTLTPIEPVADGLFVALGKAAKGRRYRKCENYAQHSVCNWLIADNEQNETLCESCRLNQVIPDLHVKGNLALWALAELAKRRLVYSLLKLQLPLMSKASDARNGLAFRFMSDITNVDGSITKILTGHSDGTITLNIREADDAFREKMRHEMKEPYRTLLGHFRHEVGHYYWDRLVGGTENLEAFRSIFGDERAAYSAALQSYYKTGAPAGWQDRYISAYATSHPWEDWAETWAHSLHIHDTLETANVFGLKGAQLHLDGNPGNAPAADEVRHAPNGESGESFDSPAKPEFEEMVNGWMQLVVALNSINRSMGHSDLYPFVLSAPVIDKLRFVLRMIAGSRTQRAERPNTPANQKEEFQSKAAKA